MGDARLAALRGILRDTRAARVADKLPEGRRPPGFAISISVGKPEHGEPDEDEVVKDEEASDKDPVMPGRPGPGSTPSMFLGDPFEEYDEDEDEDDGY